MKRYRAIAEFYDAEYASQKMLEHDVPFFMQQFPAKRLSILELGVGTGRAAIPLAQAGHRVVGVDYAADMLEIAAHKRDSVGLNEKSLLLVHSDLAADELDLDQTFDRICIFFNTFLAFPRLAQQGCVLGNVRRHLKKNGRFWIDIFQPDLNILAPMKQMGLDPTIFHVPSLDRTVYRTTQIQRDPTEQIQHVTFDYRWFEAHGQERRHTLRFEMTFLFARELQLLLDRHGMTIDHLWGNYDGSPSTMTAPRLIASCKMK